MIDENKLPEDWKVKKLGDIAKFQNGNDFSKSQWEDEGKPIIRIQNLTGTGDSYNYYSGEVDDRYSVKRGDILFAWSGTIDAFRWYGEDAWLNQHIYNVIPDNQVTEDYTYYLLKNTAGRLERKKVGSGLQHIRKSHVEDLDVPVPPLDEQERIVEAVEERLERVERLQKSVENVGRLAKEYRDSLTEYLFIDRESLSTPSPDQIPTEDDVPSHWSVKTIGEVSSQIRTGGTPKKSRDEFWDGNIPWKASKHFNENSLQLKESSEYVTDNGKSESTMANSGDVVIVCRGAHTGKVGLAQSKFLFNQDVKVIRLPESIDSEFVSRYLSNHMEYFLQKQRGGTTKGITTSHVKNLRIPIPPTEEQKNIVDELKSIDFGEVFRAVSDVDRHFEEYRGSVLAHAFTGRYTNRSADYNKGSSDYEQETLTELHETDN